MRVGTTSLTKPGERTNSEKTAKMAKSIAQMNTLKKHAFKPGQSGNPKGKPPGTLSMTRLMKELLIEAIQTKDGKSMQAAEALARSIYKRALTGNDKMSQLIWNYLDGMPKMNFDATANININPYTNEQITAIARRALGVSKQKGKRKSD